MALLSVLLTLLALIVAGCAQSEQERLEDELNEAACERRDYELNNATSRALREAFFESVRVKHGVFPENFNQTRQFVTQGIYLRSHSVRCRDSCPNITLDDVTWCVNIYHEGSEEIEVCLNSTWSNATGLATRVGVLDRLEVTNNCEEDHGPACLRITDTPFYFDHSYLTCTSHTATCETKIFYDFSVSPSATNRPRFTNVPQNPTTITLGRNTVLNCHVLGRTFFVGWRRHGMYYRGINEDPFCTEDCPSDTNPNAVNLKMDRVRMYRITVPIRSCPYIEFNTSAYLFIDNASEDDAGNYTCEAYSREFPPEKSVVTVNTVLPVIEPVVEEFPNNTLYIEPEGESLVLPCVVKAGSYANVSWQIPGGEIPVVEGNITQNCSNVENATSNVFVLSSEEDLGNYTSRYHLLLHICSVSENTSATYSCVVSADDGTETLGRVTVQLETTPEPTTVAETRKHNSNTVYIAVSIAGGFFLLLAIILVVVVILYVLRRYQTRQAQFSDILKTQNFSVPRLKYLRKNSVELLTADPMEFPRKKLHIFYDRVLGEGAFGQVLQARAEGIVEDAPQRNIVAIKTVKENSQPHEVEDLWEELHLMKRMEPHENILNLLGHCTTPGGPLVLIVEYAMYGSLKDFLKECEEVVLSLNHLNKVQSRSRSTSGSVSSSSSTYPLLVDKAPVSAQNSVFSSTVSGSIQDCSCHIPSGYHKDSSGCLVETTETFHTALAAGISTPLAHIVTPMTHDYVNTKGLVYMEDVHNFALQIACGLQHLENMQIVHCDLAARNILIAEGFVLKIADFGLARDIGQKEYYRKTRKGRIPVKWTAPEALENFVFSHKSDVWSFGVVLWEIFTYGGTPYREVKIRHSWEPFISYLKEGNRLPKSEEIPDFFYDLMLQCWHQNPDQRPSSSDLVDALTPDSDKSSGCSTGSPVPDTFPHFSQNTPV